MFHFKIFHPQLRQIFPAVKVLVGIDLFFSGQHCLCVVINIYDYYNISGKWPCVMNISFYITLTFSRLDEHFYSWSPNHLKDQDTDNLEELRNSSVRFYNTAPILLIGSVSSP